MGREGKILARRINGRKVARPGFGKAKQRKERIRKRSERDAQEQLAMFTNPIRAKGRKKRKKPQQPEINEGDDGSQSGDEDGTRQGHESLKKAKADKSINHLKVEDLGDVDFEKGFWNGPPPPDEEPDDALKLKRKNLGVKVRGCPIPAPVEAFDDPGLPLHLRPIFQGKRKGGLGIEKPTPIQAQVWPAALSGVDVIGIAPTGSGKTLGYIIPAIAHIIGQKAALGAADFAKIGTVILVLAPTRELAKQVSDSCGGGNSRGWLKRLCGLRTAAVYGGIGKDLQVDSLITMGTPHILSATPGRLLDLLSLGVVSLASVSYLVLDEADRMLALGFEPQLSAILRSVRSNRQLLLFSATFPGKLREAVEEWMSPQRVVIRIAALELENKAADEAEAEDQDAPSDGEEGGGENTEEKPKSAKSTLTVNRNIHQVVAVCPEHKREQFFLRYLQALRAREKAEGVRQRAAVLVFCGQIRTLQNLSKVVHKKMGERSASIHSQLSQTARENALSGLKNGIYDTLFATDVAARGIHISRLKHVVNYEFPGSIEVYCHRVGRVGRAGAEGWALSLIDKPQAALAPGLVSLLEGCGQSVGPELGALAAGKNAAPTPMPDVPADQPKRGCLSRQKGDAADVGKKAGLGKELAQVSESLVAADGDVQDDASDAIVDGSEAESVADESMEDVAATDAVASSTRKPANNVNRGKNGKKRNRPSSQQRRKRNAKAKANAGAAHSGVSTARVVKR